MIMPVSKTRNMLIGISLMFGLALQAQAGDEDPIAKCASLETDGDRIACLEAAIRQRSTTADDSGPPADPLPQPAAPPDPAEPAGSVPRPRADVSPPPDNNSPAPAAASTPPADTFGLKEKKPPELMNTIKVSVTSVRKDLRGKLVFETESGQVWVQTGQRVARFGDTPFEAEIRPASMGSYFIKATTGGVSVRVRRDK